MGAIVLGITKNINYYHLIIIISIVISKNKLNILKYVKILTYILKYNANILNFNNK